MSHQHDRLENLENVGGARFDHLVDLLTDHPGHLRAVLLHFVQLLDRVKTRQESGQVCRHSILQIQRAEQGLTRPSERLDLAALSRVLRQDLLRIHLLLNFSGRGSILLLLGTTAKLW